MNYSTDVKYSKQVKPQPQEADLRLLRAGEGWGVTSDGYRASFGGDGKILESVVVMVVQFSEYTKTTL